jgi:hypothetical protein
MLRNAIFVSVLLSAGLSVVVGQPFAVDSSLAETQTNKAIKSGQAQRVAPLSIELRNLPPEEYVKLHAQALAGAIAHMNPKLKNPRISNNNGLDPAIVAGLQEQQAYLQARHRLTSGLKLSESSTRLSSGADLFPDSASTSTSGQAAHPHAGSLASRNDLSRAPLCNGSTIRSVNGKREHAVFTPQTPHNHYIIEGCSFGTLRGLVQLELGPNALPFGTQAQPITLQVDTAADWSDHEIEAHLDSRLSGIPDLPVTLAIYPRNGQRLELPGCLFVAVRGEPQLLSTIPASWVKLDASAVRSRAIQQLEYVSPSVKGAEVANDAVGMSALIVRSDSEQFGLGSDTFDFSRLSPGWVVDSVQLQTYTVSCPGDVIYARTFGRWDTAWERRSFTVTWQNDVCVSYRQPFFSFNLSFSQYAANVWVIGPIGTQPVSSALLRAQ